MAIRVLEPPRVQLTAALERAIARGALPADLRIDIALAQLVGPMVYAHIMTLIDRKEPAGIRELIVDAFIRSYGVPEGKAGARATGRRRATHQSPPAKGTSKRSRRA